MNALDNRLEVEIPLSSRLSIAKHHVIATLQLLMAEARKKSNFNLTSDLLPIMPRLQITKDISQSNPTGKAFVALVEELESIDDDLNKIALKWVPDFDYVLDDDA